MRRPLRRRLRKLGKRVVPDTLVAARQALVQHRQRHGSWPRIWRPRGFTEKVAFRKAFDRRALLTQLTDKYEARKYVEERLGPDVLPRLYFATKNPSEIPFDDLPDRFVVKPTHGSGWVEIVRRKADLDRAALIATCERWLGQSFYEETGEWAYRNVVPRILVEELIDDGTGAAPLDYKLFVFDGEVACIQVDADRFVDHRCDLYLRPWQRLDVKYGFENIEGGVPEPKHLDEMIAAAETLGRGIDFVRVDLYDTDEKFFFGEFTITPGNGMDRFEPLEYDEYFGKLWKLRTR